MTSYAVAQVMGGAAELHQWETWKTRFKDKFQSQPEALPTFELDENAIKTLLSYPDFAKYLRIEVKQLVAESLEPKPTPGSLVYKALDKKTHFLEEYADQFVAIDVGKGEFVASGKTLEEAMDNARAKTDSMNLYFKRVGRNYLFKA